MLQSAVLTLDKICFKLDAVFLHVLSTPSEKHDVRRGDAQWLKGLSLKHEDQNLDPQIPSQSTASMVAH